MIEVHLRCCWTIVFLNKAVIDPTPTVWVCQDKDVYDRSLADLSAMNHIEIIQNGPSHVEGLGYSRTHVEGSQL